MNHLAVLVIGNEILSGKVQESNALFVIRELQAQGGISHLEVILDEVNAISEAIVRLSRHFSYVVTSGGVGPTHDDITLASIAKAFKVPCIQNSELAEGIQRHFGAACNATLLAMANLPQGTELLRSSKDAFPVFRFRNIFILPGLPHYFQPKFLEIKPFLLRKPLFIRALHVGLEESTCAEKLFEVEKNFPQVRIGSYPKVGQEYSLLLTFESYESIPLKEAILCLKKWFPPQIPFQEEILFEPDSESSESSASSASSAIPNP
jgi:molybdenum cofactor synthesis domain-containing protein